MCAGRAGRPSAARRLGRPYVHHSPASRRSQTREADVFREAFSELKHRCKGRLYWRFHVQHTGRVQMPFAGIAQVSSHGGDDTWTFFESDILIKRKV